jgi:hypothetical protein
MAELAFQEYQVLASRTLPRILDSNPIDLAHMALGMTSELSEIADAHNKIHQSKNEGSNADYINLSEEYADVAWYLAGWCTIRGYEMHRLSLGYKPVFDDADSEDYYTFASLDWCVCEISDLAKKYLAYGKEIPQDKEMKLLSSLFYCIYNDFEDNITLYESELTLGKALANNIAKLLVRYPDKFDKDKAITRDLIAERKELEK